MSLRMELMTRRRNSSFCKCSEVYSTDCEVYSTDCEHKDLHMHGSCAISTHQHTLACEQGSNRTSVSRIEHAMYPTCFSAYLQHRCSTVGTSHLCLLNSTVLAAKECW